MGLSLKSNHNPDLSFQINSLSKRWKLELVRVLFYGKQNKTKNKTPPPKKTPQNHTKNTPKTQNKAMRYNVDKLLFFFFLIERDIFIQNTAILMFTCTIKAV